MNGNEDEIYELAFTLLKEAGLSSKINSIVPINQGGNNRLFHIKHNCQDFLLKKYFNHASDVRNRLLSEYSFLEIAYKITPQFVPKSFAKIEAESVALYEFIPGNKIKSKDEIKYFHINKAAQFIASLNQGKVRAAMLPNASEACFSINEHLILIENRVNELCMTLPSDEMLNSTMNQIKVKWNFIKDLIIHECSANEIDIYESLSMNKRILSPSDFGYHNCIIKENKDVTFIDFEYAGWDDPAKLVCDFFNQVAIPVDEKYIDTFIDKFQSRHNQSRMDHKRIKILLKAYRIKWCCIILNVFINTNLQRRIFANPNLNVETLKVNQIIKAKKILESIWL